MSAGGTDRHHAGASGRPWNGAIEMRYHIWPEGDTGLRTCRVYVTLAEASDAARKAAAFHGRPYQVMRGTETILTVAPNAGGES